MTPSGPVVYINSAWGNQSNTYYFLEVINKKIVINPIVVVSYRVFQSAVVLMGLEEWMESYF